MLHGRISDYLKVMTQVMAIMAVHLLIFVTAGVIHFLASGLPP